ncbi:hypothetical protein NUW58_g6588 [Xylaria curta]|uniref:Uncharacterized protein n=1 Tax=Xylaria curta TaxID=42375 RepID=A0ACC1NRB6_9PEZI|nr:hypothetical protein NUW58_g6588 [Xylaria curta]
MYAAKQDSVRAEYSQDAIAQNNKKMMEEMQMMMMGGMPGMGAAAAGSMPTMPGMDGMPPEFQAMMQQMMASGMDPSQMDPSAMTAMFSGMQNSGGTAGQGPQNQNFGGGGAGNQGQNFGLFVSGLTPPPEYSQLTSSANLLLLRSNTGLHPRSREDMCDDDFVQPASSYDAYGSYSLPR